MVTIVKDHIKGQQLDLLAIDLVFLEVNMILRSSH